MNGNIWETFSAVAGAVGDRRAILSAGRWNTYAEVRERALRFAEVMRAHGLGAHVERDRLENWESGQDLVGLYLLNGPEYLEASLGGYAARVAPFNVNYRYVADELAYLLDDASAAAVVYHSCFAPTLAEVLPRLGRQPLLVQVRDRSGEPLLAGALDYEQALAEATPSEGDIPRSSDDLYVLYTGGTTGMPKGTLWRQADIYVAALGGRPADLDENPATMVAAAVADSGSCFLPNAPLMHGAAQWMALRQMLTGGAIVVNGSVERFDPDEMWSTIDRERVNSTLFVGEAFARPAMSSYESGHYDGSSLKVIVVGGAVTSSATKERIVRSLPGVIVLDAAGASETGTALSRITTAGSPSDTGAFQAQEGAAVLAADLSRCLAPGEDQIGWFAKSGCIPLGYLGDEAKTAATFPVVEGVRWSVPGDRARIRSDGSVELLGRDSVTINSGGEKIFAEEVEQAILAHPAVEDAVVTGRPSDRWGQEVVAIVQMRSGQDPTDSELLAVVARRIARYKLPKKILRVERVVRSPAGKADYRWAHQVASG